tara:strand:+ start:202 stop:1713 length:1512 start_codon:yes stop_codon:yes gene_type:complete
MPSQAELDAQNNASRARQQASRGIEQPAPQVQQPYVDPYGGQYGTGSIQDQGYYDNYYDEEEMTDEEWAAYLAGLEASQESQDVPSYYSDYGSRMPDGPIEAPYPEESSWWDNLSFSADKFRGETPFQQPDWFQGPIDRVSNDLNQFSNAQPEPEAETPFLQYIQDNTQQPQGGGANQMEQGSAGSPQSNYYDFVQRGGQMNDEQLRQANEKASSMGTTFDPETGYSRQPYLDRQQQGPQVQAPMSISDTRGMLQERFGSPTVYDQPDRSFYDEQSMLRDQRIENRPDFNAVTRDIDKYNNRRTFAEARKLVPTERDKYGKITNREEQRAAMTLTEREVQDKERDEYNKDYRAKNLEILQQRIDKGNKPGASKLDKKESNVAEELLYVQENYENFQPWMGEAIEADRMNIVPPPSGFDNHLDFAASQNNFNLDELYGVYETMSQENNGEGSAATVQQRSPSPAANSKGMKKPPQEAIDDLRSNPSRASEFDQYFGQGSSAKFL